MQRLFIMLSLLMAAQVVSALSLPSVTVTSLANSDSRYVTIQNVWQADVSLQLNSEPYVLAPLSVLRVPCQVYEQLVLQIGLQNNDAYSEWFIDCASEVTLAAPAEGE